MEERERDLEYWKEELRKVKDPVSGEYYFYSNYVQIQLPDGSYTEPPKLTEEEFYNQTRKSVTRGRTNIEKVMQLYKNSKDLGHEKI